MLLGEHSLLQQSLAGLQLAPMMAYTEPSQHLMVISQGGILVTWWYINQTSMQYLHAAAVHLHFSPLSCCSRLNLGDPLAVLPILHFVLLKYSRHVVAFILAKGVQVLQQTCRAFQGSCCKRCGSLHYAGLRRPCVLCWIHSMPRAVLEFYSHSSLAWVGCTQTFQSGQDVQLHVG